MFYIDVLLCLLFLLNSKEYFNDSINTINNKNKLISIFLYLNSIDLIT